MNNPNNPNVYNQQYGPGPGGVPAGQQQPQYTQGQVQPQGQVQSQGQYPQGQVQPQGQYSQGQQLVPLPPIYMPDEQMVQDAYQQHSIDMASGNSEFLKFTGPNGGTWETANVGDKVDLRVWICPSAKEGSNIFVKISSHFVRTRTKPKGTSVTCIGPGCKLCAAIERGKKDPNPQVQATAEKWSRVRTQYLYQVFALDDFNAHFGKGGVMKPLIYAAPNTMHAAIGNLISQGGLKSIVHPQTGCPVIMTKKKKGLQDMEIDYFAACQRHDEPLPAEFNAGMYNLHDLDTYVKAPDDQEVIEIIQSLGLPMDYGTQGYNPAPNPANYNPYPVQPQAQYQQPVQQYVQPQGQQVAPQMYAQEPQHINAPAVQSAPIETSYQPNTVAPNNVVTTPQVQPQPQVQQTAPVNPLPCMGNYNSGDKTCDICAPMTKEQCKGIQARNADPNAQGQVGGETLEQLAARKIAATGQEQ